MDGADSLPPDIRKPPVTESGAISKIPGLRNTFVWDVCSKNGR
jgi:hypothetical protein